MIQYFFVYIVTLAFLLPFRNASGKRQKIASLVSVIIAMTFAGLRGYVGNDTYMYHTAFRVLCEYPLSSLIGIFEPLFLMTLKCVAIFTKNSFVFIAFIAVIQLFLIIAIILKSKHPVDFTSVFIAVFYLDYTFNIIRAGIAVLLLILAQRYLAENKTAWFRFLCLIAILVHYSAVIIALPLIIHSIDSWRIRLGAVFVIIGGCFVGYGWVTAHGVIPMDKLLKYISTMSQGDALSWGIGLFLNLILFSILFYCTIDTSNKKVLGFVFGIWMISRVAMIEYLYIDRIENLIAAMLVFWMLDASILPKKQRIRDLAVLCVVVFGAVSSLRAIRHSSGDVSRGFKQNKLHAESSFYPYRFIWEEK